MAQNCLLGVNLFSIFVLLLVSIVSLCLCSTTTSDLAGAIANTVELMKNGDSVGALHAMGKFPELLHCEEHPDSQQLCNTVSHLASTVSHIEDGGPVDEKALLAEAQKATENIIPMIKKNGNALPGIEGNQQEKVIEEVQEFLKSQLNGNGKSEYPEEKKEQLLGHLEDALGKLMQLVPGELKQTMAKQMGHAAKSMHKMPSKLLHNNVPLKAHATPILAQ